MYVYRYVWTYSQIRDNETFQTFQVVLSKDPQLDGCGAIPPDAGDAPALIDEYLRTKVGQLIAQSEDLLAVSVKDHIELLRLLPCNNQRYSPSRSLSDRPRISCCAH
jgi:hypothetical protein